jgi:hypothetical protein
VLLRLLPAGLSPRAFSQYLLTYYLNFYWLSSEDNLLADHLSRGRWDAFLLAVYSTGFWPDDLEPELAIDAGRVRGLDSTPIFEDVMGGLSGQTPADRGLSGVDPMEAHARETRAAVMLQALSRGFLVRHRPARVRRAPRAIRVGGWTRWPVMLLCLLGMLTPCGAMPEKGVNLLRTTVSYDPTDIFTGLPERLLAHLDVILDNRLSQSSMRSAESAYAHWTPVADQFGWDRVILSNEPERGGKMVAFVMHLLEDTDLKFSSIENYVWGLREYMKLQRQADPCMNVRFWSEFMASVKVLAWVPAEPRRAIPRELIVQMLEACYANRMRSRFVNFALFLLVLYFSFSRSECPCPKNFTGPESWDPRQHWMVRDIVIKSVNGMHVLAVRFKAVKQDPRVERPAARGDGSDPNAAKEGGADWAYIGNVPDGHPDGLWSVFMWYRLYMGFFDARREPTESFFLDKDMIRPYTYTSARADLFMLIKLVGWDPSLYGVHGLRVQGYNDSKDGNGEELTVVHGLWKQGSNNRYDRFNLRDVFAIPANMVGGANVYTQTPDRPLPRVPARSEVERGATTVVDRPAPAVELPPGWTQGQVLGVPAFIPPSALVGATPQASAERAWRVHHAASSLL